MPKDHRFSFCSTQSEPTLRIDGFDAAMVDTIWLRRRGIPAQVSPLVDDRDAPVALQESAEFWKMAQHALCARRVVNKLESKLRAQSKLAQLTAARRVGLNTPDTLISNDPDDIRSFLRGDGGYVFKSLSPVHWKSSEGGVQALYTSKICLQDLEGMPDELLSTPAIYQARVAAKRELRVNVFGDFVSSAEVRARHTSDRIVDWRYGYYNEFEVAPASLPHSIRLTILDFMKEMDLSCASIDLIEDVNGDFQFLEVNESGQFLWIENMNPEIRLLAPFCEFLIHGEVTGRLKFDLAALETA